MYHKKDSDLTPEGCIALAIIFTVLFLLTALVLQLGWNHIVVDLLELTTKTINYWTALLILFVLNIIKSILK